MPTWTLPISRGPAHDQNDETATARGYADRDTGRTYFGLAMSFRSDDSMENITSWRVSSERQRCGHLHRESER